MADARHAVQRGEERAPAAALRIERTLAVGGEAVKAAAPGSGFLDPAAVNEAAALEAVQRGVERRDVELEGAFGSVVDQARDLVAVAIPFLVMHDAVPALRVSNAVAIALLYVAGHAFGRIVHRRPFVMGISMVVLGSTLVAITMALGG